MQMKIGIVGLGLIGGTYAKSLRPYRYHLVGIDIDPETIAYARMHKIVDEATDDPKSVLGDLDVVFLCLYPDRAVEFMRKHINHFKRDAIVSDVAGIKRYMIDQLDIYKDDIEMVFAHPIAGRETPGIKHSNEAIFQNANFVITPTKHNSEEALNLVETLARQMGFSSVTRIQDHEHDDIIAYTSQLTHAIAISLVNSDDDKYDTRRFIGDSYKDLTRIAMINDELWAELFLRNKDFLTRRINAFEAQLDLLKKALADKDRESLRELMRKSMVKRGNIK